LIVSRDASFIASSRVVPIPMTIQCVGVSARGHDRPPLSGPR
jgi:hypothetical protein